MPAVQAAFFKHADFPHPGWTIARLSLQGEHRPSEACTLVPGAPEGKPLQASLAIRGVFLLMADTIKVHLIEDACLCDSVIATLSVILTKLFPSEASWAHPLSSLKPKLSLATVFRARFMVTDKNNMQRRPMELVTYLQKKEQAIAEALLPEAVRNRTLEGSVIDENDYSDYARYYEEYDDDEEVADYYFSSAAGRARISIGNRRLGPNGFMSSGRMRARPAAPQAQNKVR